MILIKVYNNPIVKNGRFELNRRIIARVAIIILLIVILYLSFIYIQPIIVSKILPTQTSIFAGHVDIDLINKLRSTQSNGQINKEQAIGLAELYCMSINNSPNQQNSSNVRAYHLTEGEAIRRLNVGQKSTSSTPVWLVSMDGLWEHVGGPVPPNTDTPPLIYSHCKVIINAQTGDMMGATN